MTQARVSVIVKLLLVSAVGALLLPAPALAGPFLLETVVGANLGCDPAGPYGGTGQCLNDEDPVNFQNFGPDQSFASADSAGAGYVSVSHQTDGFDDTAFTYFAQADGDFGSLSASVTGSFDLGSEDLRFAFANTTATDLITINATGLTGTTGTLTVGFTLDGSVSSAGEAFAGAQVGVQWGQNGPWGLENEQFGLFTGPATISVPTITFTYGTPFYLMYFLGTFVGTPIAIDGSFVEVDGTGSGTASFFNTLTLSSMQARDAAGNLVNAQFVGASGTQYTENGVVPEPATLALTAFGLAGALVRKRRARR